MHKKILMGVSVLAIMAALPAFAADSQATAKTQAQLQTNNEDKPEANTITTEEAKREVRKAGDAIERAAENTGDAIQEKYKDMRAFFDGDKNTNFADMQVAKSQTAAGIIGQPLKDMSGKQVGKVHDIIVDSEGEAEMIVVSDGGFMGLGDKLAAFDYDVIVSRSDDGDVISTVTQETLDRVAPFSYDTKDAGDNVRMIPSGGYSVSELMDAQMTNSDNKKVAEVENISFADGEAELLIVAFDQVLGMGGEKAAVEFEDVALSRANGELDFRLTPQQSVQFESYRKTASN